MTIRKIWDLSGVGNGVGRGRGRLRMQPKTSQSLDISLMRGDKVFIPNRIRVEIQKGTRAEDVPHCDGHLIVSDKAKAILQELAPHLIFILVSTPASSKLPTYWYVHCVKKLTCHHRTRSSFERNVVPKTLGKFDVDYARIPAGSHVFRIRYREYILAVSDEVKRRFEANKITGAFFRYVPWDPYTWKSDWKKFDF